MWRGCVEGKGDVWKVRVMCRRKGDVWRWRLLCVEG